MSELYAVGCSASLFSVSGVSLGAGGDCLGSSPSPKRCRLVRNLSTVSRPGPGAIKSPIPTPISMFLTVLFIGLYSFLTLFLIVMNSFVVWIVGFLQ